jgi:hypothetical protein
VRDDCDVAIDVLITFAQLSAVKRLPAFFRPSGNADVTMIIIMDLLPACCLACPAFLGSCCTVRT